MNLIEPAEGPIVLRPGRQRRFVPRKVYDTAIGSYFGLDLLSRHVPGPLSDLGIDQHVRIFERLGALGALCVHSGVPFLS